MRKVDVNDITDSELALGLLWLVEFTPAALLVLVTGTVADRFDRRIVASCALVGQRAATLALLLYPRTDPTEAASACSRRPTAKSSPNEPSWRRAARYNMTVFSVVRRVAWSTREVTEHKW